MEAPVVKETSEAKVVKQVLLSLSQEFWPGLFWRQNAGKVQTANGYWVELGPEGIADIVGFLPSGQIVFVECKRRSGRQRKSQVTFQSAAEKGGALYVVARTGEQAVEGIKSLIS